MSIRIRQIVVVARELAPVVAQCQSVLGVQVAYRDPEVGKFGLENALLPIGDQFLEVVAPIRADTTAGRHLDRYGETGYMLILQSDDLARDRARLEKLHVRVVWQSSHEDMSSVHLHPKDIGATIVSIDQPIPPASWRWAGPSWQQHVTRTGAQKVLQATISARDPFKMAQRWAEVLGTNSPIAIGDNYQILIDDGALNFERADRDVLSGFKIAMPHPQAALAAAQSQGVSVRDTTVTICGTKFQL